MTKGSEAWKMWAPVNSADLGDLLSLGKEEGRHSGKKCLIPTLLTRNRMGFVLSPAALKQAHVSRH